MFEIQCLIDQELLLSNKVRTFVKCRLHDRTESEI